MNVTDYSQSTTARLSSTLSSEIASERVKEDKSETLKTSETKNGTLVNDVLTLSGDAIQLSRMRTGGGGTQPPPN